MTFINLNSLCLMMMVEFKTETMKTTILNTVDITVVNDVDEFEYVRRVQLHTLFSDCKLDSHTLAYSIFKSALYVIELNSFALANGFIYEVKCTYPAPDEEFDLMAYGEEDDLDY